MCKTRIGHFTGQVICTACDDDCEHYICTHEDEDEGGKRMNYVYDDYEFVGRDECVVLYCSQDAIYETADGPMCGGCASRSLKEDDENA